MLALAILAAGAFGLSEVEKNHSFDGLNVTKIKAQQS